MKNEKQPTAVQFWTRFISDIAADVHDIEYKNFLKAAAMSHCLAYARLTNRDTTNIRAAADAYFKIFNRK